MRRLFLSSVALLGVIGAALASNIPLISGPLDPANIIGTLNQSVIQATNYGVTGLLGSLPAAVTSSGTAKVALFNASMAGNQLNTVGQSVHIKAIGVNSADANVKTLTFDFGAASCALVVTGNAATWSADFWITMTGAATQNYSCQGQEGTTLVASVQGTATVSLTAGVAMDVSATAATSGTMTLSQAWVEQIK